jgi:hypothetical protein
MGFFAFWALRGGRVVAFLHLSLWVYLPIRTELQPRFPCTAVPNLNEIIG